MSEQQSQIATAVQAATTSACPHPEAVGQRWGDPISAERQAELRGLFEKQKEWVAKPEAERGESTFKRVNLTGADVFWLAEQSGRDEFGWVPNLHLEGVHLREAHLEGAVLEVAHLEGADLPGVHLEDALLQGVHLEGAHLALAHLEGTDLHRAHLERAILAMAHLEGADLRDAHLEGADLREAHLEGADLGGDLGGAHLERATLVSAHLEGVHLREAHLEGAILAMAHLEGADLREAHLEGADLRKAHLEGANLRRAGMDKATRLNDAALDGASLDQLTFDGANLAVVKWETVTALGDEVRARTPKDEKRKPQTRQTRQTRLDDYEAAVRAHLQLAAVLRSQGMAEQADRFTYRAQTLQRTRYRLQRRFGQWLFSILLFLMAGYGYRIGRIIIAYGLIVGAFAAAFLASDVVSGQSALSVPQALDALQISLNAIHGRVFFVQFHLDSIQSWLATAESIVGIVIEGVFVAMLIQKFFGR